MMITPDGVDRRGLIIKGLLAVAVMLLVLIYSTPTWWVALKAPNYPPEAFPDGVRIHFHMNGVFNGCELLDNKEKYEAEALDCVHEMDAINHFVGMYPIASGGVVEKAFSQFLLSMLGVMMVGFMVFTPRIRLIVLGLGFAAITAWMFLSYYTTNGLLYQSNGYLQAMVTSLGQGQEEEGEELSPIIAQLKHSLEESGESSLVSSEQVQATLQRAGQENLSAAIAKLHSGSGVRKSTKRLKTILDEAKQSGVAGKELNLHILKSTFQADQARLAGGGEEWQGSGQQVLFWHYAKSLGRWFNNPEEITPLVENMKTAGTVVFWGIIGLMLIILVGARKNSGVLYWSLVIAPILLPLFFIIEYASWLWWYGHSLNDLGAFTLKPFMPTVFGQGKVAQFSTHSYPHVGFALIIALSLLTAVAALLRRQQLRGGNQST